MMQPNRRTPTTGNSRYYSSGQSSVLPGNNRAPLPRSPYPGQGVGSGSPTREPQRLGEIRTPELDALAERRRVVEETYRRADRQRQVVPAASSADQPAPEEELMLPMPAFGPEPRPVYDVRAEHLTATVWQRPGQTGLAAYSVTLVRHFYSRRSRQYLTTTKLFAEDVPLAIEALTTAYAWMRAEIGEPLPF